MSDREYMRKLIDEVLGDERNKLRHQSGDFGIKFTDDQVCKYYLAGFCPYLQFQNTKSDIGNCPRRFHEERLKDQFLAEGDRYRKEYELEFMTFLDKLVNDLERKLRKGKDRLDVKPSDPTAALNPANDEFEEKRTILDLQIKEALKKMEEYGEEGRIQEAQELSQVVDRYKAELDKLRHQEAENPSYRLEKKMEVCQTCGAFLIVGDTQKRIEAHFEGRQHNGWARVREALADLQRKYGKSARDARMPSPEPGEIGDDGSGSRRLERRSPVRDRRDRDRSQYREPRDQWDGRRDERSDGRKRETRGDHDDRNRHYNRR